MSKSSRAVGGPLEPSVVPPVPERAWLARAELLHEQTGMPWREAHELALTEHGIGTAAIDELIGECAPRGVDSLLTTPDDLREFCRAVLVFGEALREDAADALTLDLADAALAAWDCIAELPATQARAEVVQGIDAAITALLGDTERVRGRKRHNV
mgnify:FL=1